MITSTLNSNQNPNIVDKSDLDMVFMAKFGRPAKPNHADATDSMVFNQSQMSDAAFNAEILGGAGAWRKVDNDEDTPDARAGRVGNKITFFAEEFAQDLAIAKRFYDDDQYDVVSKMVEKFGHHARVTRDKNAFSVFRNAFTTALTADGVSIINASHTALSGDTVSNTVSGALSDTTLNQAIVALEEQKDEAGEIVGHEPAVLLVPTAKFKDACILTDSRLRPSTANNDMNVYSDKYGLIVKTSPYLGAAAGGSDNAWFLMSEDHSVFRWVRQGIETVMTDWSTSKNRSYLYRGSFRETVGALTYEGIVGSLGT